MFRATFSHHQEHFWTAVAASGFRIKAEVDVFPAVVCLLVGRQRLQFNSAPDDGQNVARNMLSSVYTTKQ
jgi:hypothetical protein